MAIYGVYKDKGRSLRLMTSILEARIKDFALHDDSISLDPLNAAYVDIGEFVVRLQAECKRPTVALLDVVFAGEAGALEMPKCVFSERGSLDTQSVEKIPLLTEGILEGQFHVWAADSAVNAGDELCVAFFNGADATWGGASGIGYTGVKGVLFPFVGTELIGAGGLTPATEYSLWVVGVATSSVSATGEMLQAEIYSTPLKKTITTPAGE